MKINKSTSPDTIAEHTQENQNTVQQLHKPGLIQYTSKKIKIQAQIQT